MKIHLSCLVLALFMAAPYAIAGAGPDEEPSAPADKPDAPITSRPSPTSPEKHGKITESNNSPIPKYNPWKSIGAIIFMLGLLLAASAYLRKKQGFALKTGKDRSIKLLEKLSIDQRQHLLLVQADDKKLLLGVSSESINLISVLDSEVRDQRPEVIEQKTENKE